MYLTLLDFPKLLFFLSLRLLSNLLVSVKTGSQKKSSSISARPSGCIRHTSPHMSTLVRNSP